MFKKIGADLVAGILFLSRTQERAPVDHSRLPVKIQGPASHPQQFSPVKLDENRTDEP